MGIKEYFILFLDTVFCSRLELIVNFNEPVNEGILSVDNVLYAQSCSGKVAKIMNK